jgi:hypothetical protein
VSKQESEFSFFSMGVKPGEKIGIYLDGRYVGDVKFVANNSHKRLAWKVSTRLRLQRTKRNGNKSSRRHDGD